MWKWLYSKFIGSFPELIMNKFKVGDRVRIYGPGWNHPSYKIPRLDNLEKSWVGIVTEIRSDLVEVKSIYDGFCYAIHYKQCRRLIPKKRRSVWVDFNHRFPYHSGSFKYDCCDYPIEGWTEFREVVKK